MKQYIKRFVVFAVVLTLILGLMPGGSAQAAKKKKTKTITVTTQEELVAALKKYKSSGSTVTIKIETTEKSTFTLNAKYSSDLIKIVVDAPNATFKSKATVSSITINEAKSVKEYASGNKITVNDEKLTFTAMPTASVEKLTIASETGTVKVVNNGGIEKVAVKSEVKVDLTQNGEVGRVYVGAAADISVSGTSEESLKVTVQKDAVGASVKSEVPVSVNAYGTVDLTLDKGAENSKVTVKEETAGVKLENKTEETVSVKDSDGKTQKVETGEEITSENYVGKTDETETPVGETETEQPKEEEKKEEEKKDEEKKEEEKRDDASSTTGSGVTPGGSTSPEPYNPPAVTKTPEEKLREGIAALTDENAEYEITENVTLTSNLEIPAGRGIAIADGKTLDAKNCTITLGDESWISILSNSSFIVKRDPFEYTPNNDGYTASEIIMKNDAKLVIGGCTITGYASDPDQTPVYERIHLNNMIIKGDDPAENYMHTERWVSIDFLGENLLFSKAGGTMEDIAKAFGSDTSRWNEGNVSLTRENGGLYTEFGISYLPNVLYDKRAVKFNDTVIKEYTTGPQDWITCLADNGLYYFAFAATAKDHRAKVQKVAPTGLSRTPEGWIDWEGPVEGEIVVSVGDTADFTLQDAAFVRYGGTLKSSPEIIKRILGTKGSVIAEWGGKIQIGEYLFETSWEHGTEPDMGRFSLGIRSETITIDGKGGSEQKTFVKLQLPEDVVIKKQGGGVLTADDVDAFNGWARTNDIIVEIINKSRFEYQGTEPWDPDYFPAIKLDNTYFFTPLNTERLVKGVFTGGEYNDATKNYEYSTGSLEGLMGIWNEIERPCIDQDAEPKWSTITLTGSLELEHMTMSLPATLEIKDSNKLSLNNNAHLTASVSVASGSAVSVGSLATENAGCSLGTTQGGDCHISGTLTVYADSSFASQMGSTLIIENGGVFELNGDFYCGVVKYIDEQDEVEKTQIWFKNNGGTVTGSGNVEVIFFAMGKDISFTDEEKTNIIAQITSGINNNFITVEERQE
ncbi:MAG: hypothetical protein IKR54_03075 [Lachnospiraceae bacterium]|nr:hypothetical protein [Lachnospiraceae bacterium]